MENALSHMTRDEINEKLALDNHSMINNVQIPINSDDDRSPFDMQSISSSDDQSSKRVSSGITSQTSYQSTNSGFSSSSSISSMETRNSILISEIEEDLQHSFYSSTDDSSGRSYQVQSKDNRNLVNNHSNFLSRMFTSHHAHKLTTTTTTTIHESKICSLM